MSTSSIFRKITQASTRNLATAAKNPKNTKITQDKRYPTNLLIYDAGDTRTTFVAFWKAVALLQFGTCIVFITPMLYRNENQPNKYLRSFQAVGVTMLAAIPCALLSFLTAPYVSQIHMQIPHNATRSLAALLAFARNPPSSTRLSFLTLRIFPIGKATATSLSELRALPARSFRMANLERVKGKFWEAEQRERSFGQKVWQLVNEPRWKFYVKEGRAYTVRTGVPGVWEEVAKAIGNQTTRLAAEKVVGRGKAIGKGTRKGGVAANKPTTSSERKEPESMIRRQTSRLPMR